jgi:hypothetical protein
MCWHWFGCRGRCHCRHRRSTACLLWQFEEPRGFLKFLTEKFTSSATTACRLWSRCPRFWWWCCKGNLKRNNVHKITAGFPSMMCQQKCFYYRLTYWHT